MTITIKDLLQLLACYRNTTDVVTPPDWPTAFWRWTWPFAVAMLRRYTQTITGHKSCKLSVNSLSVTDSNVGDLQRVFDIITVSSLYSTSGCLQI